MLTQILKMNFLILLIMIIEILGVPVEDYPELIDIFFILQIYQKNINIFHQTLLEVMSQVIFAQFHILFLQTIIHFQVLVLNLGMEIMANLFIIKKYGEKEIGFIMVQEVIIIPN